MQLIRLTGHIDVAPARRDAFAAALPEHIRLTRAEPGCLSFDVAPDAEVAGRWLVAELFANRQAFAAHQARSDASAWAQASAGVHPSIRVEEVGG